MMSKLAASAVFQVRTFDVGAYVAVPLLLAVVTAVACLGPASRAARVDAMQSLREE
jgi:ABC-type lipoprotein release transport system permease subunit